MARLTSFTVDGVEVAADRLRDLTLNLDQQMNGRSVLDCVLIDPASSYRPDLRQEVVMELDFVRQFGGVVWDQTERDIGTPGTGAQNTVAITDFSALIDKVLFNGPIVAGTLASQLVPLVANLGPQGITLSVDQEDGPAMTVQAFEFLTIRECLDALSVQSRWIWSIDAFKVLRMVDPGTIPAPFEISEDDGNYVSIEWNRNLNEYANEMWGRYGPHGVLLYTESHTGDGISTAFVLQQQLVMAGTGVTPAGYVTVTRAGPSVSLETIDADPLLGTAQWHYDVAATWNNQIIQGSGATLIAGETVSITYNAQFPGAAFARDGDEYAEFGPFTDLIDFPDIINPVIAQATLDGELRRRIGISKRVTLVTDDPGLEPRMTLTFDVPSRELVGDYLIVSVRTREVSTQTSELEESGDRYFRYEVECIEGNEWRENWEPFWLPEPSPRTGGTPIFFQGCTAVNVVITEDWETALTVDEQFPDVFGGAYNVVFAPGEGVNGSRAIKSISSEPLSLAGISFAKANITPQFRTGCVEVRFKADPGIIGASPISYVSGDFIGSGFVMARRHDPDFGVFERLQIFLTMQDPTPPTSLVYESGDNFVSETNLDWYRMEFGISTWNGGSSYNADGYIRVYRNGALVFGQSGYTLHPNIAGTPGDGLQEVGFACAGTMDNYVLRTD